MILQANSFQIPLKSESVHCVVTSPPYWGLRDYGLVPSVIGGEADCEHVWIDNTYVRNNDQTAGMKQKTNVGSVNRDDPISNSFCQKCSAWRGSLGLEPTPELFCEHMVKIFREIWRVLRDDGTVWLNLGDTFWGGKGQSSQAWSTKNQDRNTLQKAQHQICSTSETRPQDGRHSTLKPKDLCGIPWRVAFALQADGWYLRRDIIWCLSGGAWVYARTQKGDMPMMVNDMYRLDPATIQLWNGEKWTQLLGMSKSERRGDEIEIVLRSGERISCTPIHKFPTQRGLLEANEIKKGDVLLKTIIPEPDKPKRPKHIDSDVAWFVGLYIAEGSRSTRAIQIAGHIKETERWKRVHKIATAYGGSATQTITGNKMDIRVYGRILHGFIDIFVSGKIAKDKSFSPAVWKYPNEFLRNLMLGYLHGDAHWDKKNNRWRIGFTRNYNLERDIRTACARLGWELTLNLSTATCNGNSYPSFRGEIRSNKSNHGNTKNSCEVVTIRKARCRYVYDLGVEDTPHLFALASGILTHNSKPAAMPESVTDRPTTSHEYVFLLTKKPRYFYDGDAIKEKLQESTKARYQTGWNGNEQRGYIERKPQNHLSKYLGSEVAKCATGRNARSVWTINTRGFKEAHFACVDEDTEALTPTGWRRYYDLQNGDIIAAYNRDRDCLRWETAAFHVFPHFGPLVSVEKRDTSQRMTLNHRCLVKHRDKDIEVVEANNLSQRHSLLMSAMWDEADSQDSLSAEKAALVGWYITEGHVRDHKTVGISQSIAVNPNYVDNIRKLLVFLQADFREIHQKRMWKGRPADMAEFRIVGNVATWLMESCPDKKLPWSMVMLPKDIAMVLLSAVVRGDGHTRKDGRSCIVQKDQRDIERFQVLAIRLGYRAIVSRRRDGMWVLYLTQGRWLTLRGTNGRRDNPRMVNHKGCVWCPSIPSSFWLARRQGRPFITGNTFPPELAARCIKAGTSEQGCCPECGAPWVRVVENTGNILMEHGSRKMDIAVNRHIKRESLIVRETKTVGWKPTCDCKHTEDTLQPAIVLDPFGGSGTVLDVAQRLGRQAVVLDLKHEYCLMAKKRCYRPQTELFENR